MPSEDCPWKHLLIILVGYHLTVTNMMGSKHCSRCTRSAAPTMWPARHASSICMLFKILLYLLRSSACPQSALPMQRVDFQPASFSQPRAGRQDLLRVASRHQHTAADNAQPLQQQSVAPPPPLPRAGGRRPSAPALLGAGSALVAVGSVTYTVLSSQPQLPPLQHVLGPAAAVLLGGPAAALLLARAVWQDKLHIELHR